ncbi:hypothetical protein KGM_213353 [Danaus plexippus plexippus]|uniref:Uncharacterized protein n=1 Tax=Danaus plexippus plexippus TaxID=278856 RepID=A0A212EJN4_DANPL|nr:hypothetical protein KGM_213353 [Danaus plexippus plexippus]
MRTPLLLAALLLACVLVCSSPIDPKRILINRPREHDVFKRSDQVKGGKPGVKGYEPPMPALRKGEFMCGNRVCRLKPGQIPPGCNGACQYRVN